MPNITSLIPNEHLGKLVTLNSLREDLSVLLETAEPGHDFYEANQHMQWSIAVSTWLVAHNKTECVWLYTPTETVYSEAAWYKGSLTEALGVWAHDGVTPQLETISEGGATVSEPTFGYLCINQERFTWQGKLYRALVLGNGDSGASALADYFIIEA